MPSPQPPAPSPQPSVPVPVQAHSNPPPSAGEAHSVCGLVLRQTTLYSLVRELGRVIISEMFWLAFALYADLLAVVVLWQICFAHFWCDILILLQSLALRRSPLNVRLKSAKKFYFKQFSFAFVWHAYYNLHIRRAYLCVLPVNGERGQRRHSSRLCKGGTI